MLVEEQDVPTSRNIRSKSKLCGVTSIIILDENLLHSMGDEFDEPRPMLHHSPVETWNSFSFAIAERTQVKTLQYVIRRSGKNYDFHLMICQHLQCLWSHVSGAIVHQSYSFLVCECFIRWQSASVGKKNF
jgi:hypothetical protein